MKRLLDSGFRRNDRLWVLTYWNLVDAALVLHFVSPVDFENSLIDFRTA